MKIWLLILLLLVIPAVYGATPFCTENRITPNYNSISPIFCLGKDINENPLFSVEVRGEGTNIPFIMFTAVSDKSTNTVAMIDPHPQRPFATQYRRFDTFTVPISALGEAGYNGKTFKIIPSVSADSGDSIQCSDSTGIVFKLNDLVDCTTRQPIDDIANASGISLNSIAPEKKSDDELLREIETIQNQIKQPANNTNPEENAALSTAKKFFLGVGGILIVIFVIISAILLQHLIKEAAKDKKEQIREEKKNKKRK